MDFDAEVHSQVEQLVSQINDPADLRELTVLLRKYDHQADHDGRCAVCERLGEAVDICITRLAGLQSDASAKELVRLLADESLHWDGVPSMWLGHNITRMGPIALPALKAVAAHPFVGERVRLYIDLIGRSEVYGP